MSYGHIYLNKIPPQCLKDTFIYLKFKLNVLKSTLNVLKFYLLCVQVVVLVSPLLVGLVVVVSVVAIAL